MVPAAVPVAQNPLVGRSKVDSIGGRVDVELVASVAPQPDHQAEAFLGWSVGVQEDHPIGLLLDAGGAVAGHDVVLAAALEFDQSQVRLLPGDPIARARVAHVAAPFAPVPLHPQGMAPRVVTVEIGQRLVPHVVGLAHSQNRPIQTHSPALPRVFLGDGQLARLAGRMNLQTDAVGGFQEPMVDEDLAAVTDVERGCGLPPSRRRHEQGQRKTDERDSRIGFQTTLEACHRFLSDGLVDQFGDVALRMRQRPFASQAS